MKYRHDDKAGNRGDLWKHAVLIATIERLAPRLRPGRPFVYGETHAGAGIYPTLLPEHEALVRRFQETAAYPRMAGLLPMVGYHGSFMLACRLLREMEHRYFALLIESDFEAAERARRAAPSSHVNVRWCNGWTVSIGGADLVLVDPPYVDPSDWGRAALKTFDLSLNGSSFLLWWPIDAAGRHLVLAEEMIRRGCRSYEARWPGGGCGMWASAHLPLIDDTLARVRAFLEGEPAPQAVGA